MRNGHAIAAGFLAALFATAPSLAQDTAEARSGEEVRVGWIGSVGENCTVNPSPDIEPAKLADGGQIRVTEGEVTTDSVAGCPDLVIPAKIVFYTSNPGFVGTDEFAFTVSGEGAPSTRTYTVTVTGSI